jgi:Uma2 family endonuclease
MPEPSQAHATRDTSAQAWYEDRMVALRKSAQPSMTVAEFLDWDPRDAHGRRWQLIDGVPVAMAPAADRHGSIQSELGRVLGNHLIATNRRCRVVTAGGIIPHARATRNFRIPDLVVTCAPPGSSVMVPEPILLVEILSPGNETMSWNNIWTHTTIPNVQEILAIHSTRIEAELLRRIPGGDWPKDPEILRVGETLTLSSLDYAVTLADLYRTTDLVAE